MSKIEEALDIFACYISGSDWREYDEENRLGQALDTLYNLIHDEVIGEDLECLPHFRKSVNEAREAINQYKAEQRKALNTLFGKEESNE